MTHPEDPQRPVRSSETGWPSEAPLPSPVDEPAAHDAAPAYEDAVARDQPVYDNQPVHDQAAAYEEPVAYDDAAYDEPAYGQTVANEAPAYDDQLASEQPATYDEQPDPVDLVAYGDTAAYEEPVPYDEPLTDEQPTAHGDHAEPEALAAAPDEPAAAAAARPRSAWRSGPVLALLLTAVLMAVANGFVWYLVHDHDATESARRAGLEASRDAARVLFSYDYRTLDKDFSAGKALTTGSFRKQYADTTSKVVTSVATEKKAVVKADVVTAGVVRASESTVVTIVYVNQVTTSSLQTGPKVDLSRVRMTLKHVGGRWLVSNVEAL